MENRVRLLLEELAEETGLSVSGRMRMLYGTKNGYAVCLGPVKSTNDFIPIGVSISRSGELLDREKLRQFAEEIDEFLSCEVRQNRARTTIRVRVKWENETEIMNYALEETTDFLRKQGYQG